MQEEQAMKHGNTKSNWYFFVNNKQVKEILGADFEFTNEHRQMVEDFFAYYPDRDRSGIWRKNIAIWIKNSLDEWIFRREQVLKHSSNSIEWLKLMYGDNWETIYNDQVTRLKKNLPNTVDYWKNKGYSINESIRKVSHHQGKISKLKKGKKDGSIRCFAYWAKQGYSEIEANVIVAGLQKRDEEFFITKYSKLEGVERFDASKDKRRNTWKTKDKTEHAKKTCPKSFNSDGQEMQMINGFLKANNIPANICRYGKPCDQFYQYIPEVGYRRYDLAVFKDESKKDLTHILEYHGPGHINFSDYVPELAHERITVDGKQLLHLGTYGEAYNNDKAKRNWILKKYPGVKYVVVWTSDLVNKRFAINELL